MDLLMHLWLPILLSSVAVWIVSAIIWMAMPHHKNDYTGLPNEDAFMAALRNLGVSKGNFGFPHAKSHSQCKDPEFQKKWKEGPAGFITVMSCDGSMAKPMVLSFLVYLITGVLIAYLLSITTAPGEAFLKVFQVAGTAGVLAYTFGQVPHKVWFGASRNSIIACVFDGVLYGLITGAIFAAMWPKA